MNSRIWWQLQGFAVICVVSQFLNHADGCCAVSRATRGAIAFKGTVNPQPVLNADQEVIMIWDATHQTQHFIRRASFKTQGDDEIGFLIPSPSQPELSESGNDAFPYLAKLTAPEIKKVKAPRVAAGRGAMGGFGSAGGMGGGSIKAVVQPPPVRVLEEKLVAGFNAVVLEADSSTALVKWLKDNDFVYSPEIEAWAKPYIEQKWKITALKVAKDAKEKPADPSSINVSALRMTFHTKRPLFPYREPDSTKFAEKLEAKKRLLRIYFIAEAKYQGELTPETRWTGKVAWSGKLNIAQQKKTLELLKLPPKTGPETWWLTEFEDAWPYKVAPADLYFSKSGKQDRVRRPAIIQYVATPVTNADAGQLTAGVR